MPEPNCRSHAHPAHPSIAHHQNLLYICVPCGQDELLGYTEREEWAELASIVDHAVLFNLREADRQVRHSCPCNAHAPLEAD